MLWKCLDSRREVEEEGHGWPAVSSGPEAARGEGRKGAAFGSPPLLRRRTRSHTVAESRKNRLRLYSHWIEVEELGMWSNRSDWIEG
jgi:hypothetical protein